MATFINKILFIVIKLITTLLLLIPYPSQASSVSFYGWNFTSSGPPGLLQYPQFEGDARFDGNTDIFLDPENNRFYNSVNSTWTTLLSDQITVADIIDILYVDNNQNAQIRTDNGFYWLKNDGGVIQSETIGMLSYVEPSYTMNPPTGYGNGLYFLLEPARNCIWDEIFSGCNPLPTDLFTVSDILDITDANTYTVTIRTKQGFFIWDRTRITNAISPTQYPRFRGDYYLGRGGSWFADTENNCLLGAGFDSCHSLTTDLFSVADIIDIPSINMDSGWVTLTVRNREPNSIPEPSTLMLLILSFVTMASVRRSLI